MPSLYIAHGRSSQTRGPLRPLHIRLPYKVSSLDEVGASLMIMKGVSRSLSVVMVYSSSLFFNLVICIVVLGGDNSCVFLF